MPQQQTNAQKAKWPLGKEKPLVVKTMQVTVFLADARNLYGAESRTRTDDLLITNQLLYQLSYFGPPLRLYRCGGLRENCGAGTLSARPLRRTPPPGLRSWGFQLDR